MTRSDALIRAQNKYRKDRDKLPGTLIPYDIVDTLNYIQDSNPEINTRAAAIWWCIRYAEKKLKQNNEC